MYTYICHCFSVYFSSIPVSAFLWVSRPSSPGARLLLLISQHLLWICAIFCLLTMPVLDYDDDICTRMIWKNINGPIQMFVSVSGGEIVRFWEIYDIYEWSLNSRQILEWLCNSHQCACCQLHGCILIVCFKIVDCLLTVNQPWQLHWKPVFVAKFVAVNGQ